MCTCWVVRFLSLSLAASKPTQPSLSNGKFCVVQQSVLMQWDTINPSKISLSPQLNFIHEAPFIQTWKIPRRIDTITAINQSIIKLISNWREVNIAQIGTWDEQDFSQNISQGRRIRNGSVNVLLWKVQIDFLRRDSIEVLKAPGKVRALLLYFFGETVVAGCKELRWDGVQNTSTSSC